MTKRFKINPDFTCHELAGYKLPEIEGRPVAIEVEIHPELYDGTETTADLSGRPVLNPDGTVKVVKWIFNE